MIFLIKPWNDKQVQDNLPKPLWQKDEMLNTLSKHPKFWKRFKLKMSKTIEERMTLFATYLDRTKLDHKQYQFDGVRWILNNELRTDPVCGVRGGFIADEMGLGKTIMMIGTKKKLMPLNIVGGV